MYIYHFLISLIFRENVRMLYVEIVSELWLTREEGKKFLRSPYFMT
jgi:hypothetical protein